MQPFLTDVLARERIDRFHGEAARYRLALSANGRAAPERSDPQRVKAERSRGRSADPACAEC
jgi:hypothetical protein